ncbi:hypothetical protein EV2_005926 [Malus domestica]
MNGIIGEKLFRFINPSKWIFTKSELGKIDARLPVMARRVESTFRNYMSRPMRIKVTGIVRIGDELVWRRIGIGSGTSAPTSTSLLPTKLFEEHCHFLIDGVRECSNRRFQSSNSSAI